MRRARGDRRGASRTTRTSRSRSARCSSARPTTGVCQRAATARALATGNAGRDRRRGRHHRRPVDRRAGHAADHADVPHRRRRRRRHHARPAARRRAVRGAQAEGPGEDRRGRRHGRRSRTTDKARHGRHHRRRAARSTVHVPAPHAPVRRARREDRGRARSSTRARSTRHELLAIRGRTETERVPRQGGAGGLQVPGRGHQRQAHRADRAPDAQEGAGRPEGRHRPACRASSSTATSCSAINER